MSDTSDEQLNKTAFPLASVIAKTFGNDFSAEICRRKAKQDIRELILDKLTPNNNIMYNFHKNTLLSDIRAIMAELKENGYECNFHSPDPRTKETRIVIALPKSK